jgi:hypothetical protein
MQLQQLKSMVESGLYKPEPALVAAAMLGHRGVRELLIGAAGPLMPAGRNQRLPAARRQAA